MVNVQKHTHRRLITVTWFVGIISPCSRWNLCNMLDLPYHAYSVSNLDFQLLFLIFAKQKNIILNSQLIFSLTHRSSLLSNYFDTKIKTLLSQSIKCLATFSYFFAYKSFHFYQEPWLPIIYSIFQNKFNTEAKVKFNLFIQIKNIYLFSG